MIAPVKHNEDLTGKTQFPTDTVKPAEEKAGGSASYSDQSLGSPDAAPPVQSFGQRLSDLVGRYPLVSIAVASTIGATAGWLVKRRF